MKKCTYYIDLDIERSISQGCISLRRGESGRQITAQLTRGGEPYVPADGSYAVLLAEKPDGTQIFGGCFLDGGRISFAVTAQMTAAAGAVRCEIRIYGEGGELLITPWFTVHVFETAADESGIVSLSEATALTELICDARAAIERCERAGFDEITATVDKGTGTPAVEAGMSESGGKRCAVFAFSNLKGADGSDASVTAASIKSALGYTPGDSADITELTEQSHGHGNKAVLDKITGILTAGNVDSPGNTLDLVTYQAFMAKLNEAAQQIMEMLQAYSKPLNITVGGTTYTYNGTQEVSVTVS